MWQGLWSWNQDLEKLCKTLNPLKLSYIPCSVWFSQGQQGRGSWGDYISISRPGERRTPRVAHGATATAREKGEKQCHCMNSCCMPGSTLGTLCTLPHVKNTTHLWGLCTISLITDEKNWHQRSHTQHNWSLNLNLSDCEARTPFSLLYVQTYHIASTTSQRLFISIKPLNLYYRLCL